MSLDFWEVVERAKNGPLVTEKTYDLEIFYPKLLEVSKKYEISYDPSTPVPSDENLTRRVFEAALEFYSEVGTYCIDTNRIIHFKKEGL